MATLLPSLSVLLLLLVNPEGLVAHHLTLINVLSAALCLLFLMSAEEDRFISFCAILVSAAIIWILSILFGAHPRKLLENMSWSFFMSTILCVPTMELVGRELVTWQRIFTQFRFKGQREQLACMGALGTMGGAWVGAFPILLDWNRPWQVWPIPCVVGALIGNLLGYLCAAAFFMLGRKGRASKLL